MLFFTKPIKATCCKTQNKTEPAKTLLILKSYNFCFNPNFLYSYTHETSAVHGRERVLAIDGGLFLVQVNDVALVQKLAALGHFLKGEQSEQVFELNARPHSVCNVICCLV